MFFIEFHVKLISLFVSSVSQRTLQRKPAEVWHVNKTTRCAGFCNSIKWKEGNKETPMIRENVLITAMESGICNRRAQYSVFRVMAIMVTQH